MGFSKSVPVYKTASALSFIKGMDVSAIIMLFSSFWGRFIKLRVPSVLLKVMDISAIIMLFSPLESLIKLRVPSVLQKVTDVSAIIMLFSPFGSQFKELRVTSVVFFKKSLTSQL